MNNSIGIIIKAVQKALSNFRFNIPDKWLFIAIGGILAMSFLALSSAASGAFLLKQFIFFLISLAIISFLFLFDIQIYRHLAQIIYWLNIGLLIFVKFAGTSVMGSQRWINLGPVNVQPSEIAKICIIIALAAWLSKRPISNYWDIFVALSLVGLPAILVFIQPDLGTTLVFMAITFGMLLWAGANMTQILILISPGVTAICSSVGHKLFTYTIGSFTFSVTVPVVAFLIFLLVVTVIHYKIWQSPWKTSALFLFMFFNTMIIIIRPLLWGFLKDYQQQRLTIFLDPSQDPLGAGYHIIQSLYAIGSGGPFGRGLKAGELTQGNYVPEQHTDFIFSVIGEEFGFIGSLLLVILFAILCLRIIRLAYTSEDSFSSLVLIGIFSMFIFHIFINIGMNLSLMPITGVPLPFMSYGGTSLLVDLFLVSLVAKVAAQRDQENYMFR